MSYARWIAAIAAIALVGLTGACTKESGQTIVVYTAVDGTDLAQVEKVLAARVTAIGLQQPSFTRPDGHTIEMRIPGHHRDTAFLALANPARLTLRKIIDMASVAPSTEMPPLGPPTTIEAVRTKLGADLLARAEALTAPTDPTDAALSAFANLTSAEVAVLPVSVQFNVGHISCAMLVARPAASLDDGKQMVSCEQRGDTKYLLDVAKVGGADVNEAEAKASEVGPVVTIGFTAAGQAQWTALTREAVGNSGTPSCRSAALGAGGNCRVGFVLNAMIISAPEVMDVITGDSQLAVGDDFQQARVLAAQLDGGVLPPGLALASVTETD